MINQKAKEPDLVEGLLSSPEFMMIGGRPGIGKTNLAAYLGLCLATGRPFFRYSCRKVKVNYIAFEGSEEKMAERFRKLLRHFPELEEGQFNFALTSSIRLSSDAENLKNMIGDAKVIIVDPFKYIVPGDFCSPKDARDFLGKLRGITEALNISFVYCHHVSKPKGFIRVEPDDLFQLKGATDYVDAAESVLLLERTKRSRRQARPMLTSERYYKYDLYFAKTRNAPSEYEPLSLKFNHDSLLFEPEEEEL